MPNSLLPPNATPLQRAVEQVSLRAFDIGIATETFNRPAIIDAGLLPWLAWQFSVDRWQPDWTEARKRAAVTTAIVDHRRKGTPAALEKLLGEHDPDLRFVEWFELTPRGTPHTFRIVLPLGIEGGPRSTAAFAAAVVADVVHVKPARSHFRFVQLVGGAGNPAAHAAFVSLGLARIDEPAAYDPDAYWDALLQTENGEPLTDDTLAPLEHL